MTTRQNNLNDFPGDLFPFFVRESGVPFLQPQFPLSTEQQYEMYLEQMKERKKQTNRTWSTKSLHVDTNIHWQGVQMIGISNRWKSTYQPKNCLISEITFNPSENKGMCKPQT